MSDSVREDGYYWVRRQGEWDIAHWTDGQWWSIGTDDTARSDSEAGYEEIGPRIMPPSD